MIALEKNTILLSTQESEVVMPVIVCPHCKNGSEFTIPVATAKVGVEGVLCAIGFCLLCHGRVWFFTRSGSSFGAVSTSGGSLLCVYVMPERNRLRREQTKTLSAP